MATMAAIEGLLLLVMAVVGALCAVQDIRKSIVPNCWIAAGIMIAAVLQTIDQLLFAREYGAWWLANMAVGDALAILMYAAGLWAAGDAKLFLLMYLCVPSRLIEPRTLSCVVIPYCFIFIPAVVWLIADSVYLTLRHAERFGAARLSARDGLNMLAVMAGSDRLAGRFLWRISDVLGRECAVGIGIDDGLRLCLCGNRAVSKASCHCAAWSSPRAVECVGKVAFFACAVVDVPADCIVPAVYAVGVRL